MLSDAVMGVLQRGTSSPFEILIVCELTRLGADIASCAEDPARTAAAMMTELAIYLGRDLKNPETVVHLYSSTADALYCSYC